MDPNEALRIIRLTIKQLRIEAPTSVSPARPEFIQHARDLAETVAGLDEWLSADGILPEAWLAEEDRLCLVEHGDWTGPHVRITSCPVVP